jgi:P27 family predicted phage terminase small subunit
MPGRKPKPTALKKLAGNPGRRPLNEQEPNYAQKLPPCPTFLGSEARKEWRRTGKILMRAGVLKEIDRTAFAAYCQSYAAWVEAEREVAKLGTVVKTKNDHPILNPYVPIARAAFDRMTKMLGEFGMTPSSRSRIHVDAPVLPDTDSEEHAVSWRELRRVK